MHQSTQAHIWSQMLFNNITRITKKHPPSWIYQSVRRHHNIIKNHHIIKNDSHRGTIILKTIPYQSTPRHRHIIKYHPLPIYQSPRPHQHMIEKEPYTKYTQTMARNPNLTRHLPIPHIGEGQEGRCLELKSRSHI